MALVAGAGRRCTYTVCTFMDHFMSHFMSLLRMLVITRAKLGMAGQ